MGSYSTLKVVYDQNVASFRFLSFNLPIAY
jgi:hypothetical protein